MPTSLGPAEIVVILVVALIVLGPNKLPEAGRHVGKALAEVRHWSQAIRSEMNDVISTEVTPAPRAGVPDSAPADDAPSYTNGSAPGPEPLAPPEPPAGDARTP